MSQAITLQEDLTVTCNRPGGPRITIPSGTLLTFPDAVGTTYTGYQNFGGTLYNRPFATALCAAADFLKEIGGRAALEANEGEFTPQTVEGVVYNVTFGPDGQATFDAPNVSPSASPSASPSSSGSASPSASPSRSVSSSPSASPSSSASASVSRSPSASPSASSDFRLKNNVQPLVGMLGKLAEIQGVSFSWKDDGGQDMGVIAQEVQRVFPELVTTDSNGYLQVRYNGLIGALLAAVQELDAKVQKLQPAARAAAAN